MEKMIYFFGNGAAEGNKNMKETLGGKGANLAEMTNIGIPVPPGFTISTHVCQSYYDNGGKLPQDMMAELDEMITRLEKAMGSEFGNPDNPLLVSVRSGAAVSMPGMMDTVLNLGINDRVVEGLARLTSNRRFALDVYRRFIQMFGDVVMGIEHDAFEEVLETVKAEANVSLDTDLTVKDLQKVIDRFQSIYVKHTGGPLPEDPKTQLVKSVEAVFSSWNNPRARKYRELHNIKGLIGTAVNVQCMVYGNLGDGSATGVAFTRNPANGENQFYGEYLINAQGEDVVAGIRTPKPIDELADEMPESYRELMDIRHRLEEHYKDMQDLEFTIQDGRLFILQTRTGKRTIFSWLRSQVEMFQEGLISREEAVARVPATEFNKLFAPVLDAEFIIAKSLVPATSGLNASPGGACGQAVFTADEAEAIAATGAPVILVRVETSPEDIGGMAVAKGVLTARGGMTSHAAVVARGMGCPCVSGAGEIKVNYSDKSMSIGTVRIQQGEYISIDGFTGEVYTQKIPVKPSEIVQVLDGKLAASDSKLYQNYEKFMAMVDELRTMKVRTNADNPKDVAVAVRFGAEGIGLCRTEHMFFEEERIPAFRRLILVAETVKKLRAQLAVNPGDTAVISKLTSPETQYNRALGELLPLQRSDFNGIFKELNGLPATIRLLDPPLHEFLPHDLEGQKEMAETMNISVEEIKRTVESLGEFNPMLGHRGCRLGISYPEVTQMQVRAIIEAALEVHREGITVQPEIMIPLAGHVKEFQLQKDIAVQVIAAICSENGLVELPFKVLIGTMIEVPRAAITADEIAQEAEFFSFGTNDLTQMGCGFSRDDAGKFLSEYVQLGIYEFDPFEVLDQNGIGQLVRIAVEKGRKMRPSLKIGICGEHGGEPRSVNFCHQVGMDYVSCSPYRVPVARLAAAQAVILERSL